MEDEEIDYQRGDVILATYGHNTVLDKPFQRLYEYGYETTYGCVVYKKGETNMQDASAFRLEQIRPANSIDIRTGIWG